MRTRLLAAVVATAALLSGCYLFNSKSPSVDPDEVMTGQHQFDKQAEAVTTLRIWVFYQVDRTANGSVVSRDGYFKTVKMRVGQPQ
jgi:hypothetical protein